MKICGAMFGEKEKLVVQANGRIGDTYIQF